MTVVHQLAKMDKDNSPVIISKTIKVFTVAITLQVIDLVRDLDFFTFKMLRQVVFLR